MRGRSWLQAMVCALAGCGGASDTPEAPMAASGPQVEMVGAGVISTALPEFASTLSAGEDTIYFNRTPADRSRLDLFVSERVGGEWTEPRLFQPTRGESAIDPFLSLDGRRLYFSSNRPLGDQAAPSFNLWYVDRTSGSWGVPTPMPRPINTDSSDIFNSFAVDGTMVFSSRRSGERRIYSSRLIDGTWSDPTPLTFGAFSGGSNPMVSVDGSFMVIAAPGPADGSDLYVSCRLDGAWAEPLRLPPPINSEFAEFAPGIAGEHLYFTSERPGVVNVQPDSVRPPGDIYRTELGAVAASCRLEVP